MTSAWDEFFDELARWSDIGRSVDFWWRDDDATRRTVPLDRLVALACSARVPLALAVIPLDAQADLLSGDQGFVTVLQHGVAHRNAAGPAEKKTEFPAGGSVGAAVQGLQSGWSKLTDLFGTRSLRVLVPPWNRISDPRLVAGLADSGFVGLSRFGPRAAAGSGESPGLVQVNTHVDVIDWKGGRGFVGEDAALRQAVTHLRARRLGTADTAEATGWLTHHAVHDAAIWAFMQELFQRTGARSDVVWRSATQLFVQR